MSVDLYDFDEEHVAIDDVWCKHITEMAMLIDIGGKEFWMPKSQVHEDSEVTERDDNGTIIVTRWIAEQKDWL